MLFIYRMNITLKILCSLDDKRINVRYSANNKRMTLTYSLDIEQIKN